MPLEPRDEVHRLRNTMRDLVALSTLPAVWAGYAPQGIIASLADVLLNTLSLDLVFVRAGDAEAVRGEGLADDRIRLVAEALAPWLASDAPPKLLNHPLGGGALRVAVSRFGHTGSEGVVVACSRRPDFPGESDRLLLGVGANQTAVVLQRKRAERALAEERQRLRVTLSSIGDAVIATDALGRVTFMNGVAEALTGWPQAEAEGRPLPEVFRIANEYTREPGANPALRALNEGVTVGLANHTVLIARDGTERPIEDSAAPIRDGRNPSTGAVLVFRDVTERKRAEKVRHASEERLRTALSAARMVAWEWTPADRKLRVSETAAEVFGLPAGVGLTGIDQGLALVHPDDVAGYEATFRDAIERRGSYHIDYRLVRPSDGRVIWIEERGNTVFDQPGGGARLFGVAADVTERKRAESTVRASEARFRTLFDSMDQGFCVIEVTFADGRPADYRFVELNPAFGRHSGLPHDLLGKSIREAVPGLEEFWFDTYGRVAATGEPTRFVHHAAPLGRWFEVYAFRLEDADRHRVAVLFIDVTERKRAELELRDQDRKKDDFIALLAHELRNPLAPIRNGLQVLRLGGANPAAAARARDMMDRQLTHMVRLIDDLLDVSRINRGKMELRRGRVELADVVGGAVETARPALDAAGHELMVALPATPVVLDADLTRLAQVFSNLLTNSAKYTPKGGRVWLSAERDQGRVLVAVRDTGIGIPAESLTTIFDMFSQVDREVEKSTGGLGIGLALVKGLVEMHGGTVAATSDGDGTGTTFTVSLPEAGRGGATTPVASDPPVRSAARRILVVDDNRDSAESMAMMLELIGNEVALAHDGLEAVAQAERFRPDVVLMDVGMPKLDGLEATKSIRAHEWGQKMAVIALTGWGQEADRERTREAGCDGHLVKPVSLADLEKLLADLMGRT